MRSNLLRRTPAQKDFRCTRAKRTGEAIGAKKLNRQFGISQFLTSMEQQTIVKVIFAAKK